MKRNKLESLINLLDDRNIEVVQEAMAELLKHETEIAEYLARHQESPEPQLRQRIHQLQAIITMRRRRREFAALLKTEDPDMIDGLIAVHLQWYDNDSEGLLRELWERFCRASERFAPKNITEIAYFMRKCGFESTPADELQAESFCLGPILDDLVGADFILCALASELAAKWGLKLGIVRVMDNFLLIDDRGKVLSPGNSWRLLPEVDSAKCELWNKKQILELASLMLFTFAVSSNSFRYIHTIGHSLAKVLGEDKLDFLPYPYGSGKRDKPKI
ncbi:MAG: hypothetical protein PHH77_00485 [Victivallaceae bacterium]|nr:hypothetical protein [Victivallaceae bacterium]